MVRKSQFIAVLGIITVTALAGCTTAGSADPPTAPPPSPSSVAAPPAPEASPSAADSSPGDAPTSEADRTCGPTDPAAVGGPAIASLAVPLEDASWDPGHTDYSGYDACAALSWAVVPLVRATASSPTAILLFHRGRYLGTATAEQYGFEPAVARSTEDTVVVTYRYPVGDEALADPTGRAIAIFTWDADTAKVVMTGAVPPDGGS